MRSPSALLRAATRTQFSIAVTAFASLLVAGTVKLIAVLLLLHVFRVPRTVLQAQDALITALLVGMFVWVLLGAERVREREQEKQVKVVADLNHHLRNALEVILSSDYLGHDVRASAILNSVERIDVALHAILGPTSKNPANSQPVNCPCGGDHPALRKPASRVADDAGAAETQGLG